MANMRVGVDGKWRARKRIKNAFKAVQAVKELARETYGRASSREVWFPKK